MSDPKPLKELLEDRIDAALALHKPDPSGAYCEVCDECVEPNYPCSTVKALKGEK